METTGTKNNQNDLRSLTWGGTWEGSLIAGKWEGKVKWYLDKESNKWEGGGTFNGKVISGDWNVIKGDWWSEGNDMGKWNGSGKLISHVPVPSDIAAKFIAAIGLISNIASVALGLVVGKIAWITTFISIVVILLVLLVYRVRDKSTIEGKWDINGDWINDGEFRIVSMKGKWKLGYNEGKIIGELR